MDTNTLNEIKNLAPQAAQLRAALDTAADEERTAETALLERIVELVRPALKALATRPVIEERHTGHATMTARHHTVRADFRGVCLSDDNPGPLEDNGRDNTGAYCGSDLFLLDDGTFAELEYEGTWSRWQGSTSEWTATVKRLTPKEVAAEYDLDQIIPRLHKHLVAYVTGNASKRAAAMHERAERLAAIAKLL